jgi:hypothetical protein
VHILQKELLEDFKSKFGNKTLKQFADLTGIERTRVFRIFNGQEMRIGEWDRIRKLTYGDQIGMLSLGVDIGAKRNEMVESLKRIMGLRELKSQLA